MDFIFQLHIYIDCRVVNKCEGAVHQSMAIQNLLPRFLVDIVFSFFEKQNSGYWLNDLKARQWKIMFQEQLMRGDADVILVFGSGFCSVSFTIVSGFNAEYTYIHIHNMLL